MLCRLYTVKSLVIAEPAIIISRQLARGYEFWVGISPYALLLPLYHGRYSCCRRCSYFAVALAVGFTSALLQLPSMMACSRGACLTDGSFA